MSQTDIDRMISNEQSALIKTLSVNDEDTDNDSSSTGTCDAVKSWEREQALVRRDNRLSTIIERSSPTMKLFDVWLSHNEERVVHSVLLAKQLISEALPLVDTETTSFIITLTIPKLFLSLHHSVTEDDLCTSDEVSIRVVDAKRKFESVCSLSNFTEVMSRIKHVQEGITDMLFDLLHQKQVLLGIANVTCECLCYDAPFVYEAPIMTQTGQTTGKLKLCLECLPRDSVAMTTNGTITTKLTIMEASGIPLDSTQQLHCQYMLWERNERYVVPALGYRNGIHQFQHSQTFNHQLNEDVMTCIENGTLSIEVWGSSSKPEIITVVKEPFSEKQNHTPKRLELWLEILELDDNGEFVPVDVKSKRDVGTGGIFKIHQGQAHRIRVSMVPVKGQGKDCVTYDTISSVSIGELQVSHNQDTALLDSYQETSKWMANRSDCSTEEGRKVSLASTHLQRGLCIPLTPAIICDPLPGMEKRIPLILIDPNSSDEEKEAEEESMISLPIIKRNDDKLSAVVSWDSSAHHCLTKVTQPHKRVFAVVCVTVRMSGQPGFQLRLRKKICLKVYKKSGFGVSLSKPFTRGGVRSKCGVTFEVVNVESSNKRLGNAPRDTLLVDLAEDDNVITKMKSTVALIGDALLLESMKQQVVLMESISSCGAKLMKHFDVKSRKLVTPCPENMEFFQVTTSTTCTSERNSSVQDCDDEDDDDESEGIKVTLVRRLRSTKSKQERLPQPSNVVTTIVDGYSSENSRTPNELLAVEDEIIDEEIAIEMSTKEATSTGGECSGDLELAEEEADGINNFDDVPKDNVDGVEITEEATDVSEDNVTPVQEDNVDVCTLEEKVDIVSGPEIVITQEDVINGCTDEVIDTNTDNQRSEESVEAIQGSIIEDINNNATFSEDKLDSDGDDDKLLSSSMDHLEKDDASSTVTTSDEVTDDASSQEKQAMKLDEKVMVEVSGSFKIGTIKFIGKTKFASGNWIGVELDRPHGKNNGSINGVVYFRCKEKHGVFVRRKKVLYGPSTTKSSSLSIVKNKPKRSHSFNRQSSNEWKQYF